MLPTHDEYLQGSTTWRAQHLGQTYEVCHHGVSDYNPQGTWCFYVLLDERMFANPEDWKLFDLPIQERKQPEGSTWRHFPYDDIPDMLWHCGPTFGERRTEFDRKTGRDFGVIKVGCDYNHLWDREAGYPYTLESVRQDAKACVEDFVGRFPQRKTCRWSGLIGLAEEFYEAKNGAIVHKSQQGEIPTEYDLWQPKED